MCTTSSTTLNAAVIAVEAAGAADESDPAGCRAADVLALLHHADITAGRRRSGRQFKLAQPEAATAVATAAAEQAARSSAAASKQTRGCKNLK